MFSEPGDGRGRVRIRVAGASSSWCRPYSDSPYLYVRDSERAGGSELKEECRSKQGWFCAAIHTSAVFPGTATSGVAIGPISTFPGIRLNFEFIACSHVSALPV